MRRREFSNASTVTGQCLCGAVRFEIDFPAFWAWHDHSTASRRAHGAAYATYIGTWRKRFHVTAGEDEIARFDDKTGAARSFCSRCGTPLIYERAGRSRSMINIPRALFETRTGREPIYHFGIDERPEWAYANEPLVPLKGYPGVVWNRAKKKRAVTPF